MMPSSTRTVSYTHLDVYKRQVYQWHRQEWGGRQRWVRASCLRLHPDDGFEVEDRPSIKLAQVTGERDSQPSAPDATLSASESRSGVRGTDLGVRFDHAGRSFLLFGDCLLYTSRCV